MAKKKTLLETHLENEKKTKDSKPEGIHSFMKDAMGKMGTEYSEEKAEKILSHYGHDYDKVIDFAGSKTGIKDMDAFKGAVYNKYKLEKPDEEAIAEREFIKKPTAANPEGGYESYKQLQDDLTLTEGMMGRLRAQEEEARPDFEEDVELSEDEKFRQSQLVQATPDATNVSIPEEQEQIMTPTRRRVLELQKKADEINTALASQADFNLKSIGHVSEEHEAISKEYDKYASQLKEAKRIHYEKKGAFADPNSPVVGSISFTPQTPQDKAKIKNLDDITELYGQMGKILSSPQGKDFGAQVDGVLHGFSDNFFTKDFATLGINEMDRLFNVKDAFEEKAKFEAEGKTEAEIAELMPEEQKALLDTYQLLLEVQAGSQANFGTTLGDGLKEMIPFIAQFAATEGVGVAAKASVKKFITNKTERAIVGRVAGAIAKPMVQGAAMIPAELQNYAERVAPTMDAAGNLIEGEKPLNAAFKAYITTVAEIAGEDVGTFTNKWANDAARKSFTKLIANNPSKSQEFLGKMSLALTRNTDIPGIQGVFFEGVGEEVTGLMQAGIDQDGSIFTAEAQKQLWAMSVLASGSFASLSAPNRIKTRLQYGQSKKLLADIPIEEYAQVAEDIASKSTDPGEAIETLKAVSKDFDITVDDFNKAATFIGHSAKMNQMNTVRALQVEHQIAQSLGNDGNVALTNYEGKIHSIRNPKDLGKGNENKVIFLKDQEGKVTPVISSRITDYESKSPDEIIESQVTAQDQADDVFEQEQQMQEEAMSRGLEAGKTVETPQGKKTLVAVNPDGTSTVVDPKGEESTVNTSEIEPYKTKEQQETEKAEAEAEAVVMEGIAPEAELVSDEPLTEEIRVMDFSNGQSKIVTPEGEQVFNSVEERDAALAEIIPGEVAAEEQTIDILPPEQRFATLRNQNEEVANQMFSEDIAEIRAQAEELRKAETETKQERFDNLAKANELETEAARLDGVLADPTLLPVEEAPVEEAPVEEAPVKEAPVEEAPVEEAPVKEAPNTPIVSKKAQEDLASKTRILPVLKELQTKFGIAINVIHSSEMPEHVKAAAGSKQINAAGFYDPSTRQAYILSDVARRRGIAELKKTFMHEAGVHKGLDLLFDAGKVTILGKTFETKKDLLKEVYSRLDEATIQDRMKDYAKGATIDQLTEAQQIEIAEEAMATLNETESPRLQALLDKLYNFFRKITGFTSKQFSKADFRNLLKKHRDLVAKQTKTENTVEAPKAEGVKFQTEEGQSFEDWRGDREVVEDYRIQDAKTGVPIVVKGYHGTTHEFYEFKGGEEGNIEGHLGRTNYFTSDYGDAYSNYGAQGADLTGRIERRKEQILYGIEENVNNNDYTSIAGEYNLLEEEIVGWSAEDIADQIASKELVGGEEKVLKLYVKLNNPLVLGGDPVYVETIDETELSEYVDDAAEEIREEYDLDTIEEAKEDYSGEIRDRATESSGAENKLIEALRLALEGNESYEEPTQFLGDYLYEPEVDLNALDEGLRSSLNEAYLENNEGELISQQVMSDFYEELGYDGVILTDVDKRFTNMGLSENTSHIHVPDQYNNQIKLADGSNTTFGETSDIRFQTETTEFKKWFGNSKIVDGSGKPTVMYHATGEDFNAFKTQEDEQVFGKGIIFASPDANWAQKGFMPIDKEKGTSGSVMPLYIKSENPFDYRNEEHVKQLLETVELRDKAKDHIRNGRPIGLEKPKVTEAIKALGYDGLYVTEEGITNIGVFDPKQIKSATGNAGTFDPNTSDVRFKVADTFHSPTERALQSIKQEKGTVAQFEQMLLKNGAKQAEIDWMGFRERFPSINSKVTKQEIQEWIEDNKVQIEEVEKERGETGLSDTDSPTEEAQGLLDTYNGDIEEWERLEDRIWQTRQEAERYDREDLNEQVERLETKLEELEDQYGSIDDLHQLKEEIYQDSDNFEEEIIGDTKYSDYQLPGGENYKELLMTLPAKPEYESPHFEEKNILAHTRFNERYDNEGNKVLFLEEIQSDWAQEGRKKGFKPKVGYTEYRDSLHKKYNTEDVDDLKSKLSKGEVDRLNELWKDGDGSTTPDMPFKKTDQWLNLGLRRMIRYAAENGFDKIAWTTGEQQASRYDLSKQVNNIDVTPINEKSATRSVFLELKDNTDHLLYIDDSGNVVDSGKGEYVGQNISDLIGKEISSKILGINEETTLDGDNLKIGGEGMKSFYNSIVPKAANKIGKKFGAKVESMDMYYDEDFTQLSLPITDKMKQSVMAEGQPMFQAEREKVELNPSEAQIQASNYQKGHVRFDGFDISIENPVGSIRSGKNEKGEDWSNIMPADYGYFKGTIGNDKDHIDVYMGDNLDSDKVYVVDQVNPDTGKFDEHKVMLGYNSVSEARNAYNGAYDEGWNGLGAITRTTKEGLKEWFKGNTQKPFAGTSEVKFQVTSENPEIQKMLDKLQAVQALGKSAAKIRGLEEDRAKAARKDRRAIKDKIQTFKAGFKIGSTETKKEIEAVQKAITAYAKKTLSLTEAGAREIGPALTLIKESKTPESLEGAFDRIDELADITTQKTERKKYVSKVNRLLKWMTGLKKSGNKKVGKFNYEETKAFIELKEVSDKTTELTKKVNSYKSTPEEKAEAATALDALWEGLNAKADKTSLDGAMMKLIELKRLGSKASPKLAQIVAEELEVIYKSAQEAKTEADITAALSRKKEKEYVKSFLNGSDKALEDKPWFKRALTQLNSGIADITGNWETLMTMIGGKELRDKMSLMLNEAQMAVGKQDTMDTVLDEAKDIYGSKSRRATLDKIHDLSSEEYSLIQPNVKGAKGEGKPKKLSKLHIMDIYNAVKNSAVKDDYYMAYGDITPRADGSRDTDIQRATGEKRILDLIAKLDKEDKAFADLMQSELDKYYAGLNEMHIKLYNRDLPRVENYWPSTAEREVDIDIMEQFFVDSRHPSSIKERSSHRIPEPRDAFNKFAKHIEEAEWYTNMAMPITEINKIFRDLNIKKLIKDKRGDTFYNNISEAIQNVGLNPPGKQQQPSTLASALNPLINNWVVSKIGATPSVPLKQLLSSVNYAENMPTVDWVTGFTKAVANPKQTWEEMMRIPYLRTRLGDGYSEAVQRALNGDDSVHMSKAANFHTSFKNLMTIGTRYGDMTAIIFGGKPYLDYLLKKGLSEKEAVDKFLQDTLRSQQAPFSSTLSKLQNSKNLFLKAIFAFSNTPSQYMRKLFEANQNYRVQKQRFKDGKITKEELSEAKKSTAKVHAIYGLVNTVTFTAAGSLINAFMRGSDPDDEIWKDMVNQLAQTYIGGLPVIKDVLGTATRKALDLPVYDSAQPFVEGMDDVVDAGLKLSKGNVKNPAKEYEKIGQGVATMLGIPYYNLKKNIKAIPPFRDETFKTTRLKEVDNKLNDLKESRGDIADLKKVYSKAKAKATRLRNDHKDFKADRVEQMIEDSKMNLRENDYQGANREAYVLEQTLKHIH